MTDSARPSTPPRPGPPAKPDLTPEQVRRILNQHEATLRASGTASLHRTPNGFITGQKRPHAALLSTSSTHRDARTTLTNPSNGAATSTSASRAAPSADANIQAAQKFQKYVEYDFSTMVDTKGGFLTAEDDPFNRALHASSTNDADQRPPHMTLKEWERHRLLKNLREQRAGPFEPGISAAVAGEDAKKCRECGSLEIDWKWDDVFGCRVCAACKECLPEKYSLLTKTEAREDYLLTDPELRDVELLPHLERPNPHKSTWNSMMLYLRYQVEEYAFSERKWGSADKLDEEFEKREGERKRRKEEKFRSKLVELKRRTRVEAYKRGRRGGAGGNFGDAIGTGKHEHEWGRAVENPETGASVKTCVECGMEVEELEF